ncbi:MAG: PIN/TRAM domain-containing protein [Firmicutes bacterium]|nr:PIN/TRAM domain-containing protein [Bacillota bacterium]
MLNATRVLMALLGGTIGYYAAWQVLATGVWPTAADHPLIVVAVGTLIMASLGAVFTRPVVLGVRRVLTSAISALQHIPTVDIAVGSIGLISGLIIGILATLPFPRSMPVLGSIVPIIVTLVLGYVGAMVAVRKRDDILNLMNLSVSGGRLIRDKSARSSRKIPKIVDTSVIIDGRIADIVRTGFLEGPLLVPRFVLTELQHIADSSDVLKRNRGRRGLDILNRIQKEERVQVQIIEDDLEEFSDVDSKLVQLAKQLGGYVITNDYNLNKVAELQGVRVLNINELVNAVKPLVLPGEEMVVHLIKDGKEQGQGIGYLDDGTMIVVDGGRRYIGESIGVLVTNVLQTNAGRMIFAKPKAMERAL